MIDSVCGSGRLKKRLEELGAVQESGQKTLVDLKARPMQAQSLLCISGMIRWMKNDLSNPGFEQLWSNKVSRL